MECVCVCVCVRAHTHSRHPALKAKPPGRGLWRARMRHAQSVPLFKPLSEAYLLPQRCLHRPLHQLVGCELALCSGIFLLVSVMCRWKLFWKLSLLSLLIILFSLYHYSIHTFSSWFVLTTSFCIVSSWRIYPLIFICLSGIGHLIGFLILFSFKSHTFFIYATFHSNWKVWMLENLENLVKVSITCAGVWKYIYIHYIAKVLGHPLLMKGWDYFSNFHETNLNV